MTVSTRDSQLLIFFTRFFFVLFILVAVLILLNTIMAILVEKTFFLAKQDEEQEARDAQEQKEEELKILTELFLDIDVDRSGDLTKREFIAALDFNEYIQMRLLDLDMTPEYLKETWEILDDGDGQLTVYEFTSGIRNLKGNTKTKDVMDTQRRLEYCKSFIEEVLEGKIIKLDRILYIMQKDLAEMRTDFELLGAATNNLSSMVTRFFGKAREKAAEIKEQQKLELELKRQEEERLRRLEIKKKREIAQLAKLGSVTAGDAHDELKAVKKLRDSIRLSQDL